jgi:hypothetical protein
MDYNGKACANARKEHCPDVVFTNADHIRSMTDEELMHWCNHTCPPNDKWKSCDGGDFEECEKCWLDWLKQPYKEDL